MMLSVAADRIAHPAMRCAALLARLARDERVAARRQPYDTARTAGGSSGGTGAAITGIGLVHVRRDARQQVLAPIEAEVPPHGVDVVGIVLGRCRTQAGRPSTA